MKRKHFPAEQIVSVLKQAELGMPVGDIVRQLDFSEQTFIAVRNSTAACNPKAYESLRFC